MPEYAMKRTCAECPWLLSSRIGKFPPQRYLSLASTCSPGGLRSVFACHMTPEGEERACAGMILVCGSQINSIRMAVLRGRLNPAEITASGPMYPNYLSMAEANGCDPNDPVFDELRHGR